MYGYIEGFTTTPLPKIEELLDASKGGLTRNEAHELLAKQAKHNDEEYAKAVGRVLSDYANVISGDGALTLATVLTRMTHRTLQQSIMALMLTTINAWAALPESQYDARNEFTVKLAKQIIAALEGECVIRDGIAKLPCI
jgi:hypothetical protein